MNTSASSASSASSTIQDKFNNSVDHGCNSIHDAFDLDCDLTKVVHMTHNGCCGYEAVMRFMGVKSSMRDFVVNVLSGLVL